MRFLIGYSRDAVTVGALRARGWDAWTCDLLPADHPWHIEGDIWDVAGDSWDGAIFHPMCTYLTCTAAWAFMDPNFERWPGSGYHQKLEPDTLTGAARREAREAALENFRRLLALPYPKAIENPARSFVSAAIRRPDQVVQPFHFGDDGSKATGLWLDRLPRLRLGPARAGVLHCHNGRFVERWENQTIGGQNKLAPTPGRWLERSRTWPGMARAFVQWAEYLEPLITA